MGEGVAVDELVLCQQGIVLHLPVRQIQGVVVDAEELRVVARDAQTAALVEPQPPLKLPIALV